MGMGKLHDQNGPTAWGSTSTVSYQYKSGNVNIKVLKYYPVSKANKAHSAQEKRNERTSLFK